MEEKYKVTVWCDNCGLQQKLTTKLFKNINNVLNNKHLDRCNKCGCDTLNKIKYNN